jgi:opacity protein-like surface antigen
MVRLYALLPLSLVVAVCIFTPLSSALAESFVAVEAGAVYSDVSSSGAGPDDGIDGTDVGYHFGVGLFRQQTDSRWVYGVKVEVENVQDNVLVGLRAIDLGFLVTPRFTIDGFLGAARYDLPTAAYGWRLGLGAKYQFAERWVLAADYVYNDKLTRDSGGDNVGVFYDIDQGLLYLQYRF